MDDEMILKYLGTVYFNQDYDLDADSPIELVKNFAIEDDLQYVQILYRELADILLSGISEEEAQKLWMIDAESSYDPAKDHKSYLDWLNEILLAVGAVLHERWLPSEEATENS